MTRLSWSRGNSLTLRTRYGPWAVVTGASSGLGRACADQLAAAGLHVVLVARSEPALHALARDLQAAHGSDTRVIGVDLGTAGGVAQVLTGIADLDVGLLVAAAGFGTSGPFAEADLDAELAMLEVNCAAVMRLTHAIGTRLRARGRGGVLLFGSLVGRQGTPWVAHYSATKAYVQALGEALHVEWRPQGVDVTTVAPGPVHTGFADHADLRMGAAQRPGPVARAALGGLLRRRAVVTPGGLSALLTWSLAPLPRSARARVLARVMAGMTAHQFDADRAARRTADPAGR